MVARIASRMLRDARVRSEDRDVHVQDLRVVREVADVAHEGLPRRARPFGTVRPEDRAEVTRGRRPEERVGEGVEDDVAVRVADRAERPRAP